MLKKLALSFALITLSLGTSFGAAGIYDSYIIVNGTFYDIGANSQNPDFNGAFLGNFDPSQSITLGGQEKTFKNNGTDVTGTGLDYRIWQGSAGGAFSNLAYSFQWNQGDQGAPGNLNNPGDQQWGTDVEGANTTDGSITLSLANFAPGTYSLDVFSYATTNGVDAASLIQNNNTGNDYIATFTVVPEPSSLALLGGPAILGAWFFVRRRRA